MSDNHKSESLLPQDLLKKLMIIVIGSIIAAYGITLALYAGFGGATLAVLWQGIAKTFHLSIGIASFIVALGMILFALIYDKSQIHVGTVLYAFALAEKNNWQGKIVRMHWIFWL